MKQMQRNKQIQHIQRIQGFSLMELMVVIIVIAILAALAIPGYGKTVRRSHWNATNDVLQGQGAAGTASELQSLLTGLQSASPDITILVAQLIPCDPTGGGGSGFGAKCTSDLPALNDLIGSFGSL